MHQVENALAASAAALSIGVSLDAVIEGLTTKTLSPWRMELDQLPNGAVVINDAYNANPGSMIAGLEALAAVPALRRIAVLGTMAELGSQSASFHQQIIVRLRELDIDLVVAVDEPAYGVTSAYGIDGALDFLRTHNAPTMGDAILVKGSRVAGLEKLAERLQQMGRPE
jgi:UDP-N-acetylmuramoyl-tripeptide--D-alanyl-D-alanine ligase